MYRNDNCNRISLSQLDEEAVECMCERGFNSGGVEDRVIVPIWKGKGDVQDPRKCRGIILLSHIMKLLERILDGRMRKRVNMEIRKEKQGFRKGRGMMDGMFTLRQLVDKRLEVQGGDGIGICGSGEGRWHCPKRVDDGDTEMDGSAGSRSEVGGRDVQTRERREESWLVL